MYVDGGDVADQHDGTESVLRRSERVRHRPDYYVEGAYIAGGSLSGSHSKSQQVKVEKGYASRDEVT